MMSEVEVIPATVATQFVAFPIFPSWSVSAELSLPESKTSPKTHHTRQLIVLKNKML